MAKSRTLLKELSEKDIKNREDSFKALTSNEIDTLLDVLAGSWVLDASKKRIHKNMRFEKYQDSIDFIVWVASLAEEVNHHPDIVLGYKTIEISFSTHNILSLSLADFVFAALIEEHLKEESF